VVDLTVKTVKETRYAEISAAMKKVSETYLKGILDWTSDEVVRSDFIHDKASSIFDTGSGKTGSHPPKPTIYSEDRTLSTRFRSNEAFAMKLSAPPLQVALVLRAALISPWILSDLGQTSLNDS
jgi:hypothetical protein